MWRRKSTSLRSVGSLATSFFCNSLRVRTALRSPQTCHCFHVACMACCCCPYAPSRSSLCAWLLVAALTPHFHAWSLSAQYSFRRHCQSARITKRPCRCVVCFCSAKCSQQQHLLRGLSKQRGRGRSRSKGLHTPHRPWPGSFRAPHTHSERACVLPMKERLLLGSLLICALLSRSGVLSPRARNRPRMGLSRDGVP